MTLRLVDRFIDRVTGDTPSVERRWYEVDGLRWHARTSAEAGYKSGRLPLVLVHGLIISSTFHAPLIERLSGEFDVYAPDLPGYGESEHADRILNMDEQADALARWMDVAGLRSAAILGTSYGAQLSADFAARHPDRVDRVILVGPILEPAARSLPNLFVRRARHSKHERRQMPLMWIDIARAGPKRSFALFRMMLRHRIEEIAPRVEAPALVVYGTRDLIVSEAWAEEVTRLLPHGRLVVLSGVPHPANFISPLELANVVRPFLREGADHANDHGSENEP